MSRNVAVISSDSNLEYAFLLPLTCLVWRSLDFLPMVVLTGTRDSWMSCRPLACVMSHLEISEPLMMFLGNGSNQVLKESTFAQTSRLFGCTHESVGAGDYLLTSDADMWVLDKSWIHQRGSNDHVTSFFANAYEGAYQIPRFPMCYIGAVAGVWQEIMCGNVQCQDVRQRIVDLYNQYGYLDNNEWNFDEALAGRMISLRPSWERKFLRVNRQQPLRDRVDRSGWSFQHGRQYRDAHLIRTNDGSQWPTIRPVFESVAIQFINQADSYVEAYKAAYSGVQ